MKDTISDTWKPPVVEAESQGFMRFTSYYYPYEDQALFENARNLVRHGQFAPDQIQIVSTQRTPGGAKYIAVLTTAIRGVPIRQSDAVRGDHHHKVLTKTAA